MIKDFSWFVNLCALKFYIGIKINYIYFKFPLLKKEQHFMKYNTKFNNIWAVILSCTCLLQKLVQHLYFNIELRIAKNYFYFLIYSNISWKKIFPPFLPFNSCPQNYINIIYLLHYTTYQIVISIIFFGCLSCLSILSIIYETV